MSEPTWQEVVDFVRANGDLISNDTEHVFHTTVCTLAAELERRDEKTRALEDEIENLKARLTYLEGASR